MYFNNHNEKKRFQSLLLAVFIFVFVVAGCGWRPGSSFKWGEKNPPTKGVQLNIDKYRCMHDFDKKVNLYIAGKIQPKEVHQIADCLRTAIKQFQLKTQDLVGGAYSPERLVRYFNENFLAPGKQISPEYLVELMELKKVIVGGTEHVITKKELGQTIDVIGTIEKLLIDNLRFVPVYRVVAKGSNRDFSSEQMRDAKLQLHETGRVVAQLLRQQRKNYSVDSLMRLIHHTQDFLNWTDFYNNTFSHKQLTELVKIYKEVSTGNKSAQFLPTDWPQIFSTAVAMYGLYMNYQAKLANKDFRYGPGYETFYDTVQESLNLLELWIDVAPGKRISFDTTDRLFQVLEDAKLLPMNITKNSVVPVYKHIVVKTLKPNLKQPDRADGIGMDEVNVLKVEFDRWSTIQNLLQAHIAQELKVDFKKIDKLTTDQYQFIEKMDFSEMMSKSFSLLSDAFSPNMDVIRSLRPMFKNDDQRVYVLPYNELRTSGVFQDANNFSMINILNSLVRVLVLSFSTDANIVGMRGLTENDMKAFYKVVKPIGIELKLMDPRKMDAGSDYFNESNIFTFSGDGVTATANDETDLLTFKEAIEFFSLLWSSNQVRGQLYDAIITKCRADGFQDGPLDFSGVAKINRQCFNKFVYSNQMIEISNLPYMLRHIRAMSLNERVAFLNDMQNIATIPCEDAKYIENSEIVTMSTVFHYAEVIFNVYDKNRDGNLNSQEVMQAFARFRGYLSRLIYKKQEVYYSTAMLKSIYTFLIMNQKIPSKSDVSEAAEILYYKVRYFDDDLNQNYSKLPEMSLSRSGFVRVLAGLAYYNKANKLKMCRNGR